MVGLGGVGPEVDGELGLDAQQIAPFHGPVVGELRALEQAVDQSGCVCLGSVSCRNCAASLAVGTVPMTSRIGAAQENGVGAGLRGLNTQLLQFGKNEVVDLVLRSQLNAAFEDRGESLFRTSTHQGCGRKNQARKSFEHVKRQLYILYNPSVAEKSRKALGHEYTRINTNTEKPFRLPSIGWSTAVCSGSSVCFFDRFRRGRVRCGLLWGFATVGQRVFVDADLRCSPKSPCWH